MHKDLQTTNSTGFTLIELLITTSLTVLLMLTITTMFMTFLVGSSKTNIKKTVKEEGLHAMSQMEFIMKNAHYVDGTCGTGDNISIRSLDGGTTTYSEINDNGTYKIASNSSILTSSAVDTQQSLLIECSGDVGNRQIKISFTLYKDAPTLSEDAPVSESFESTVNVRN